MRALSGSFGATRIGLIRPKRKTGSLNSQGAAATMKQDSDVSGAATRLKALRMLMVASAFWGLSFPTTKALAVSQQELLPASGSWFVASLCVVYRFAIATLVLLVLSARSFTQSTRLELEQGLGLGLFG